MAATAVGGLALDSEQRFREAEAEWVERFQTLEAENAQLRATLEKWLPGIRQLAHWSDQIGNERDSKGFAAMIRDFEEALVRPNHH